MHYDPIENTLEKYEMLVERLTKLIRDGLAESQVNEEKYSDNYLMGKNTAYAEILGAITTDLQKIQKEWEQDH